MAGDRHDDDDDKQKDIARAILIGSEQISAGLFAVAKAIEEFKPSPADKLVLTYTKKGE